MTSEARSCVIRAVKVVNNKEIVDVVNNSQSF